MSIKKLLSTAAVPIMLSSGVVYAQDQGWYMGIGVGQSKANQSGSCSDLNGVFDPGFSCSTKDTSTGAKLFGGYQFNQYIAAEFGYVNLGTFKSSASGTIGGIPVSASATDKPSGFSLDAVGTWPITQEFGVLGRVGAFAWALDESASASGGGISDSTNHKPTGISADFGIGVKYDFYKNMGVRAEFQRFKSIGDSTTGKADVDLISASFIYRFQ